MTNTVNNKIFKTTIVIGASKLKQILWYFTNALFFKNAWNLSSGLKVMLLKLFGAKIGKGVVIKPSVNIKYPWKLTIGDYSWLGENVWIDNLSDVNIGKNVCISQGALLLCGNHDYKKVSFDLITLPIILEDGVWIGAKAIVCGGVICKTHSVLSVNSVASKELDAYRIYRGNPSEKIKTRIIEN
jgi:putative colanic acid biosynthesis acetyltransferase WcaF